MKKKYIPKNHKVVESINRIALKRAQLMGLLQVATVT
jgi:hypothetical protein